MPLGLIVGWSIAPLRTWFSVGSVTAWTLILFWPAASAAKPKWDPIDPADLAATDSATNPRIGAEIIFSRELEDEHYVRAKIYNQAGVENQGLLRVLLGRYAEIAGFEARVVKRDGTDIPLSKKDFSETIVVKNEWGGMKQMALAFPNLAPGDIVEYRWRNNGYGWFALWTYCQEEIPVREFTFVDNVSRGAAVISWQNCPQAKATGEGTSSPGVSIRNLPALVREEYMPPDLDSRGWIRLLEIASYEVETTLDQDWQAFGKTAASGFLGIRGSTGN